LRLNNTKRDVQADRAVAATAMAAPRQNATKRE
jgi:hypothetical protein